MLAVAWAMLYSGLVECVCSVDMWVVCVDCGMGFGLQMARRHLVIHIKARDQQCCLHIRDTMVYDLLPIPRASLSVAWGQK